MLPRETISAVFPSSVRVGDCLLGPIALCHVVAMEALGAGVDSFRETADKTVLTAWILSMSPKELERRVHDGPDEKEIGRILDRCGSVERLGDALAGLVAEAFNAFVPPKSEENRVRMDDIGEGFGWPLELAELMMAEHGVTFDEAMATPLVRVFALVAAMRTRNGGESAGPDYYDRIRERYMKDMLKGV